MVDPSSHQTQTHLETLNIADLLHVVVDPSEEQRLVGELAQVLVRLVGQAEKHQLRVLRGIFSSDFIVKILF